MTSSTPRLWRGVTFPRVFGRPIGLFVIALALNSPVALRSSEPAGLSGRPSDGALATAYKALPLSFEANQGQTHPTVRFLARGRGYTVFLTPSEAVLRLQHAPRRLTSHKSAASASSSAVMTGPGPAGVLRMSLLDANPDPPIHGSHALSGKANYLVGSDTDKWRAGVPTFSRVRYADVYSGIDMVYYGNQGRLEYDFLVAPDAEPARIRLALHGARQVTLDPGGNLVMELDGGGELRWERPVSISGARWCQAGRRQPLFAPGGE